MVADARSVRQIVLNLLSNSIKFTGAGGQVIVSTALNDEHEVVLRVRDTGVGMSEKELQTALEPFRQLATSARWGSGGTGLGLPLTKALAEANRARFSHHQPRGQRHAGGSGLPGDPGARAIRRRRPANMTVPRAGHERVTEAAHGWRENGRWYKTLADTSDRKTRIFTL